ncbi:mucin-2-like [Pelodytes ibericus]
MGYQLTSLLVLCLVLNNSVAYNLRTGLFGNHGQSVCSAWGDFHYKTFDGDIYQFPGTCSYNLASDCRGDYQFYVHLQRSVKDHQTVIKQIIISIKDVVILLKNSMVVVNGELVSTPYYSFGILIYKNIDYIKLSSKIGLTLMWNQNDAVMLELDTKFNNQTCGLCGDYNGVRLYNEFIVDGINLNAIQFGNQQNVNDPSNICSDPDDAQIDNTENCFKHHSACKQHLGSSAFSDCESLVDPESYIQTCMLDMCSCSESQIDVCLCNTITEYSRQCSHAGGRPGIWRTDSFCPKRCPGNMIYQESASPCMSSCSYQQTHSLCEEHYMDGCFCPEGTVIDDLTDKGCVNVTECYCRHRGILYSPGETMQNDCDECRCISGRWECTDRACPGLCSVEGGAHFTTFDGNAYTFHGDCFYVISKGRRTDSHVILGELAPCTSSDKETCLKTVVFITDKKQNAVAFKTDGSVFLNELQITLPYVAANFSIMKALDSDIIVEANFGLQMQIQLLPIMQLYITMEKSARRHLQGLCGNFNSKEGDDFKTSGGLVEATASAFANTWKAQPSCPDRSEVSVDPCSISIENKLYADHWCSYLEDPHAEFSKCHSTIDPAKYAKICRYDACNCRKSEVCMCAAVASYVKACAAKGISLAGWRGTICEQDVQSCPASQLYVYDLKACQPTCRSLAEGKAACSSVFIPVEGCGCHDAEYLNENGECVPISRCSCYFRGTYIKPLEVVHVQSDICTCRNGLLSCITHVNNRCTNGKVYYDCSTSDSSKIPAYRSCQTLSVEYFPMQCVSECVCPDGLLDDGAGGCVPEKKCPCVHNKEIFPHGSEVKVDCNTCLCQSGQWTCTSDVCYGTCTIHGNGHHITFDNKIYDFDGNCEFVAAQDYCGHPDSYNSFRVITENIPCGSTGTTCSKAIKIFLGSLELSLTDERLLEVQGEGIFGNSTQYQTREMGIYLVIEARNGILLIWDRKTTIFIKVSPKFKGKVCGLCGNFDDNANNDFTTSQKVQVSNALEFGNSWKANSVCPDVTEEVHPCAVNKHRKVWAEKQCGLLKSKVFASCHAKVDPAAFYEACVTDACACDSGGDCECFCHAVAVYAQKCSRVDACVHWRTPDICPIFCDYYNNEGECGWHYHACGNHNMETCRSINNVHTNVTVTYLEGCYPTCPPDKPIFDESKNTCVTRQQCGCYMKNGHYEIGEQVPTDKSCKACLCSTEGHVDCTFLLSACYCIHNGTRYEEGEVIYSGEESGVCYIISCIQGEEKMEINLCATTTITTRTTAITQTTAMPTTKACNYVVICMWTPWFDANTPQQGQEGGEFETYDEIRKSHTFCEAPVEIRCRAVDAPNLDFDALGQTVHCNVSYGFICRNNEQQEENSLWQTCYNYEIRVNGINYYSYNNISYSHFYSGINYYSYNNISYSNFYSGINYYSYTNISYSHFYSGINYYSYNNISYSNFYCGINYYSYNNISYSHFYSRINYYSYSNISYSHFHTRINYYSYSNISYSHFHTRNKYYSYSNISYSHFHTRINGINYYSYNNISYSHFYSGINYYSYNNISYSNFYSGINYYSYNNISYSHFYSGINYYSYNNISYITSTPELSTTAIATSPIVTSTPDLTTATVTISPIKPSTPPEVTPTTLKTTTNVIASTKTICIPKCKMSEWLDVDFPTRGINEGDYETFENMRKAGYKVCDKPEYILCRAEMFPMVPLNKLGQNVTCDVSVGLVCKNEDQTGPSEMCNNYQISVYCCDYEDCSTTSPPIITSSSTQTTTTSLYQTSTATPNLYTTSTTPSIETTTSLPLSTTSTEITEQPHITETTGSTTTTVTQSTTQAPTVTISITEKSPDTTKPSNFTVPTTRACIPSCWWSGWLDASYPTHDKDDGDYETYDTFKDTELKHCGKKERIICRAEQYPKFSLDEVGQNVTCDVAVGFICNNKDQIKYIPVCYNYQIKVYCCDYELCASPTDTTTSTILSTTVPIYKTSITSPNLSTTSRTPTIKTPTGSPLSTTSTSITGSTESTTNTATPATTIETTTVYITSESAGVTTFETTATSGSTTINKPTEPTIPESSKITTSATTSSETTTTTASTTTGHGTTIYGTPETVDASSTAVSPSERAICTPKCEMSDWFDVDFPSRGKNEGDFETFENIEKAGYKVCDKPEYILCRAEMFTMVPLNKLGQNVTCDVSIGLVCKNEDQTGPSEMCYNYEIRVYCCDYEDCSTTSPPIITSSSTQTTTTSPYQTSTATPNLYTTSTTPSIETTTNFPLTTTSTKITGHPHSTGSTSTTDSTTNTASPATTIETTTVYITSDSAGVTTFETTSTSGSTTINKPTEPTITESSKITTSATTSSETTTTTASTTTAICTPKCEMSDWFDVDFPSRGKNEGDFETFENIEKAGYKVCDKPEYILCRAEMFTMVPLNKLGQNVTCDVSIGLVCKNEDQTGPSEMCYNYEIRVYCCDYEDCSTTSPPIITSSSTQTTTTSPYQTSTATPNLYTTSTTPSIETTTNFPLTTTSTKITGHPHSTGSTSTTDSTTNTASPATTIETTTVYITSDSAGVTTFETTATSGSTTINKPTEPTITESSKITTSATTSSETTTTTASPTTGHGTTIYGTPETVDASSTAVSPSERAICTPKCEMSDWFDVDFPSRGKNEGDFETFENIEKAGYKVCDKPEYILCRAEMFTMVPLNKLGQNVTCDVSIGLVCKNEDQTGPSEMCYNYEIRVYCCDYEDCSTTSPPIITSSSTQTTTTSPYQTSTATPNLYTTSTTPSIETTTNFPLTTTSTKITGHPHSTGSTSTTDSTTNTASPATTIETTTVYITSDSAGVTTFETTSTSGSTTINKPTEPTITESSKITTSATTSSETTTTTASTTTGHGTTIYGTPETVDASSTAVSPSERAICTPKCEMSDWFDVDFPSRGKNEGDFETFENIEKAGYKVCDKPEYILCRAEMFTMVPLNKLGQNVTCDVSIGLVCKNEDQTGPSEMCYNYEIRVYCCDYEDCSTTSPPIITSSSTQTTTTSPYQTSTATPNLYTTSTTPSIETTTNFPLTTTSTKITGHPHSTGSTSTTDSTTNTASPATTIETTTVYITSDSAGVTTFETTATSGSTTINKPTEPTITESSKITTSATTSSETTTTTASTTTGHGTTIYGTPETVDASSTAVSPSERAICTPKCEMSDWFDVDFPSRGKNEGDFETFENIEKAGYKVCDKPEYILCRAEMFTMVPLNKLGQNVTCDVSIGLVCKNEDQTGPSEMCYNYEIRVYCCDYEDCSTTSPPIITSSSTQTTTTSPYQTSTATPNLYTTSTTPSIETTTNFPLTTTSTKITGHPHSTGSTSTTDSTTNTASPATTIETTTVYITSDSAGVTTFETTATSGSTTINKPTEPTITESSKITTSATTSSETTTTTASPTTGHGTTIYGTPETVDASSTAVSPSERAICTPKCEMSDWFDVDFPSRGKNEGDFETFENIEKAGYKVCDKPEYILCRAEMFTMVPLNKLGQNVTCDVSIGLVCKNEDQTGPSEMCYNYEIRVYCCDYEDCSTTSPPIITSSNTQTTTTSPYQTSTATPNLYTTSTTPSIETTTNFPLTTTSTKITGHPHSTGSTSTTDSTTASPATTIETTTVYITSDSAGVTTFETTATSGSTTINKPTEPTITESSKITTSATTSSETTTTTASTTTGHGTTIYGTSETTDASFTTGEITSGVVLVTHCFRVTCSSDCNVVVNNWVCELSSTSPPQYSSPESSTSIHSSPTSITQTTLPLEPTITQNTASPESTQTPVSTITPLTTKAPESTNTALNSSHPESTSLTTKTSAGSTQKTTTNSKTTVPKLPGCTLNPRREHNETWMLANCTMARCLENNTVEIIPLTCKPPPMITCATGRAPVAVTDDDGCCWHWECECICSGWGDPHIVTFDGTYYSYQGNCSYVLVERIKKNVDNFGVYIDNSDCGARDRVSCPRNIIVHYKNLDIRIEVTILANRRLQVVVNGQSVGVPYNKYGVNIYKSGINYVVEIPELQANIMYNGLAFSVKLPYQLFGYNTQGQCGTCSNNRADDCMLRDGNIISNCEIMADSWVWANQNKTQCTGNLKTTIPPMHTVSPSPCIPSPLCDLIKGPTFKQCHNTLPPADYYEACRYDSCHVPDTNIECSSLQHYAQLCADKGVCVDWRSQAVECTLACPSNMVYNACGPHLPQSCKTVSEEEKQNNNEKRFVEGCFCPNGTMRYSPAVDVCVKTCGCVGPDDVPREFGERFQFDCQECVCREGGRGITCKRHECKMPEEMRCPREGFYPAIQASSTYACCNETVCKCDTSLCSKTTPTCGLGFELTGDIPEGHCCPVYNCVRKNVCVHGNAEYLPGSPVYSDHCQTCVCPENANKTTGLTIQCTNVTCKVQCSEGFELREDERDCCGVCVQTHCVMNNDSIHTLLNPGETVRSGNDNCTLYSCSVKREQFITSKSQISCPFFDENNCESGTVRLLPDGCCKTCVEKSPLCKMEAYHDYMSYNNCRSLDMVKMSRCEGSCSTFSVYSAAAQSMSHNCTCCQEVKTTQKHVLLRCPDGSHLDYEYIDVEQCNCVNTECENVSTQETIAPIRSRRALRRKRQLHVGDY